jgi:hypothetical protein
MAGTSVSVLAGAGASAESSLGATSSGGGRWAAGDALSVRRVAFMMLDARHMRQTWLIASRTWPRMAGIQRKAVAPAAADKATRSLGKWYGSARSLRRHSVHTDSTRKDG